MLINKLRKISKIIPDGKIKIIAKRIWNYIRICVGDDIITSDIDLFNKKLTKIKNKTGKNYWEETKSWNFSEKQPVEYKIMFDWLNRRLFPLLNERSEVADLACANGEFSFLIAKYVNHIDGFDLSERMIELAKQTSKEWNIMNISFRQADASTVILPDNQYNIFMLFGLMVYIIDDNVLDTILKKIYKSMKTDGYLVIKDCVWTDIVTRNDRYHIITSDNYYAKYRGKERQFKRFEENGFRLLDKIALKGNFESGYCQYCAIFQIKKL